MPRLEAFIATWEKEFNTTLRVLGNYPADRLSYRPHERSMSAADLMWLFPHGEKEFIGGCLRGKFEFEATPKPPKTKEAIVRAYKKVHREMVKRVRRAGEDLFSRTTKFFVAPHKMGDVKIGDLLWLFLHDEIHHRGQLSVYLRLVGAKVPSIYGPSADEPW